MPFGLDDDGRSQHRDAVHRLFGSGGRAGPSLA